MNECTGASDHVGDPEELKSLGVLLGRLLKPLDGDRAGIMATLWSLSLSIHAENCRSRDLEIQTYLLQK